MPSRLAPQSRECLSGICPASGASVPLHVTYLAVSQTPHPCIHALTTAAGCLILLSLLLMQDEDEEGERNCSSASSMYVGIAPSMTVLIYNESKDEHGPTSGPAGPHRGLP